MGKYLDLLRAAEAARKVNTDITTEDRRTIFLRRVEDTVNRDRQATHGAAEDNFTRVALLWSAYLDTEISRRDVAWLMVLFKAARAAANPQHEDNPLDAAGYLACLAGLEP